MMMTSSMVMGSVLWMEGARSLGVHALQHGRGRRTDHPVDERAVLEEQECRDRPDSIASREGSALVDVELYRRRAAARLLRHLLENRRDGPARAVPRGPEVDRLADSVFPAWAHRRTPLFPRMPVQTRGIRRHHANKMYQHTLRCKCM